MKTQVKENKSTNINKLKQNDFSVTQFSKDLSYGKKHEKLVMKSLEKYELKTDRMAHKTGNVYVECKRYTFIFYTDTFIKIKKISQQRL